MAYARAHACRIGPPAPPLPPPLPHPLARPGGPRRSGSRRRRPRRSARSRAKGAHPTTTCQRARCGPATRSNLCGPAARSRLLPPFDLRAPCLAASLPFGEQAPLFLSCGPPAGRRGGPSTLMRCASMSGGGGGLMRTREAVVSDSDSAYPDEKRLDERRGRDPLASRREAARQADAAEAHRRQGKMLATRQVGNGVGVGGVVGRGQLL